MKASRGSPYALFELGSNSVKFYLIEVAPDGRHRIETLKFPWRVAHLYFARGALDEEIIADAVDTLRRVVPLIEKLNVANVCAVATGVFRELDSSNRLADRIEAEVGIRPRVISGEDEARLMARGLAGKTAGTTVIWDIGGASTEWAVVIDAQPRGCGSLPLGTIRNQRLLCAGEMIDPAQFVRASAAHCDEVLSGVELPARLSVLATGGAPKAVAATLGVDVLPRAALRGQIRQVLLHGPPCDLAPARREVYLSGLVVLERIARRCRVTELHHAGDAVRDGLAHRLVRTLRTRDVDLHSSVLLHTRSW